MHRAAFKGSILACNLILTLRGDALHDTDKEVRSIIDGHAPTYMCPSPQGHTPLHYAAANNKVDVCALLLDRGADAALRDLSGHTPLDYAYMKRLDYVVALFTCHETSVADFTRASRCVCVEREEPVWRGGGKVGV